MFGRQPAVHNIWAKHGAVNDDSLTLVRSDQRSMYVLRIPPSCNMSDRIPNPGRSGMVFVILELQEVTMSSTTSTNFLWILRLHLTNDQQYTDLRNRSRTLGRNRPYKGGP